MDFDIHFCSDGILRAKLSNDKPMIPVKFLQDNGVSKNNDFRFWARWWESNIYFESGLTIGKFLSCLEPWGDFWSDLTGKDVVAYIKESRIPIVLKKEENERQLSWISLAYHTDLSPISEYSDQNKNSENILGNINEWMNKAINTRLTGEWEVYSSYKISGFYEGREEQYSIYYSPMNKLANVLIVLNDKQLIYFSNWKLNQILGNGKNHFFKDDAFGLCSLKDGFIQFIVGQKHHTMRNIVEGFFNCFPSNPIRREELQSRTRELSNINENKIEEVIKSNIIDLFTKEKQNIVNDKNQKINIDNPLNPIIFSIKNDEEYWEEMLKKSYKQNNVILKIGKIEEAKAPEKRIYGYLIKNDDDPANPKPSSYKMW